MSYVLHRSALFKDIKINIYTFLFLTVYITINGLTSSIFIEVFKAIKNEIWTKVSSINK